MKIDLSDVKIGDVVFHSQYGCDEVIEVDNKKDYIRMLNIADCKLDGTMWQQGEPEHPCVFHNITECHRYFCYLFVQDILKKG